MEEIMTENKRYRTIPLKDDTQQKHQRFVNQKNSFQGSFTHTGQVTWTFPCDTIPGLRETQDACGTLLHFRLRFAVLPCPQVKAFVENQKNPQLSTFGEKEVSVPQSCPVLAQVCNCKKQDNILFGRHYCKHGQPLPRALPEWMT